MPSNPRVYLAIDLGASGGRVVAGLFDGQRLELGEVHRFANGPTIAAGRMYWDLLGLWDKVQEGLRAAAAEFGENVVSIGVDTWGVDFGLLGPRDELLGNPFHYRDRHTAGIMESAFETVSREEIFEATGLQFMELNSLFQLLAMKRDQSPLLESASSFLMIPDLFNWLLTGEKANEFSNTTTSQLYNPRTKTWATEMLDKFGLPTEMLGRIVQPGMKLGTLLPAVATATGLKNVDIVLPGTHDTASAVMGVPAAGQVSARPDWCYISSGTWSLMGAEVPDAVINDKCRELNFTNEGGVGGTIRLLKNIAGLWLVQECRRIWKQAGNDRDWNELVGLAANAAPLSSLINPDHSDFIAPADMPATIRSFCSGSGQAAPESDGATIRCILESLALRYRAVLNSLQELTGGQIETMHIVGGGTQNELLCQMAADACNCRIIAGPVEATAIGNLMTQAVAAGDAGSIAEARGVVRGSFPVQEYTPRDPAPWDEAYQRFQSIVDS